MASLGTAFFPDAASFPNTTQYPGQGLAPIARCRISYDDVAVATPTWTEVSNNDFRAFASSRGRDTELSEFDAGTASTTLDNRDRAFDPLNNSSIRPMNRIWLYYEFSGAVGDIFKGYASSWDQAWPGGGWSDATATANASDEFTVLSQAALPVTNPPRDTYQDLVMSDAPVGYWDMNEDPTSRQYAAAIVGAEQLSSDFPEEPDFPKRTDRRQVQRGARRKH